MEPNDVALSLADGVRLLMAAQDPPWTQSDLARQLGWPPGNVSRLLAAKRSPTSIVLAQLCDAFGVNLSDLFAEVAKPKPKK